MPETTGLYNDIAGAVEKISNPGAKGKKKFDPDDPNTKKLRKIGRWKNELALAEKELSKFWERGRQVTKKYLQEGDGGTARSEANSKFAVFWSNIGVLKASLYANAPKPLVKREFDDFQDDEARVAGLMMERLLRQGLQTPESDMQTAFTQTVEDRLIPGLGQVWLSYECETEEVEVGPGIPGKTQPIMMEQITNEWALTDYVYWEDFIWSPARIWKEVRWVGRRVWMTKPEFKKKFGSQLLELMAWVKKEPTRYGERVTPETMGVPKTEVFEIWSKTDRRVYWISKGCDYVLGTADDPLELEGFFPCPPPLLATHTTSSLVPKADYLMVQSQYQRLDSLSLRISMLENAIQASGAYDKANKELGQLLPNRGVNRMIAVDNWAMFSEKGGFKGVIDWFPLEMIVNALDKLRELKQEAKMELYELTGISDIMRGVTNPRETLGAQELKSQYSSVRLQYLQGETANFIQNSLRIKAEIIAKHFQAETIIKNSLIDLTPDAEYAQMAVEVLKDDWSRCYRIEVFADTLAIPDYNAERAGRTEFIGAVGQFISQTFPLIEKEPGAAPFLLQIMQWGIASFRSAQSIEGVFDKAVHSVLERLKNPQPAPPDPKMIEAQTNQKVAEAELGMKKETHAMDLQADQTKTQLDLQATHAQASADVAATQAKTKADIAATEAKTKVFIVTSRAKAKAQAQIAKSKAAQKPKKAA